MPRCCNARATNWLRVLNRPLPLPWANATSDRGPSGSDKLPTMRREPSRITTSRVRKQVGMGVDTRKPFASENSTSKSNNRANIAAGCRQPVSFWVEASSLRFTMSKAIRIMAGCRSRTLHFGSERNWTSSATGRGA